MQKPDIRYEVYTTSGKLIGVYDGLRKVYENIPQFKNEHRIASNRFRRFNDFKSLHYSITKVDYNDNQEENS